MKLIKPALAAALLSVAPGLLAQQTTNSPPVAVSPAPPLTAEDLAEHAALVQQIGDEAARGFDAEAHAHALRLQIEALVSKAGSAKEPAAVPQASTATAPLSQPVLIPQQPAPIRASAPTSRPVEAQSAAIHDSIQKLRELLDRLENQLNTR